MKKLLCIIISVILVLPVFSVIAEGDEISIIINGSEIAFDVGPVIRNNRVLVPMRGIFEALGCDVDYYEDENSRTVTASKGTKSISLEIGGSEMSVNYDKTVTLDSPAIIENNRTLVPVRAISEALKADVEWNAETKSVLIEEYGDHRIKSAVLEKNIEKGGVILIHVRYEYPVIGNPDNNAFISELNAQYEKESGEFAVQAESDLMDAAEAESKYCADNGLEFYPLEYTSTYDVEYDKNEKLCIVFSGYYNTGGAHPFTSKESYVYDIAGGNRLTLSDIIKPQGDELVKLVSGSFENYISDIAEMAELDPKDETFEQIREDIKKEAGNVKFYITDDGLELYFDVYQVAPYAFGYPTASLSYEENMDIFK